MSVTIIELIVLSKKQSSSPVQISCHDETKESSKSEWIKKAGTRKFGIFGWKMTFVIIKIVTDYFSVDQVIN